VVDRGSSSSLRAATAVVAGAAAAVAIALWPQPAVGFGWTFWLWAAAAVAYPFSFPPAERRHGRPGAAVVVALIAILVFAAALRLYDVAGIPANISIDEVYPGIDALHIARGESFNPFSTLGWFNIPGLSFAYPAAFMKLFGGPPFHDLRLSSAIMGLAGIVATFLLGRRLCGDAVGLVAAFLMAAGFWHLHNSRTGFPFIQSSFGVPLALYLIARARQDRSLRSMAVAGLCLGLVLQGYFPVRVLVLLVPLLIVGMWIGARESGRRIAVEAFVLAGGALMTFGPLLRSVSLERLFDRSLTILVFRPGMAEALSGNASIPLVVWQNVREGAGMFVDWADVCILNRSPAGLLDGVTLGAAGIGALLAVMRGRPRLLFLCLWALIVFVVGVVLTDAPRASYRLAPAMPALYLLAAAGICETLFSGPPRWAWQRLLVWPLVMLALAFWIADTNARLFFGDYSRQGDGREFQLAAVLRLVGDECDGRRIYWIAGDQARQADLFELFCRDAQSLDHKAIPKGVMRGRHATFIVMRPWPETLARLEKCYPGSHPETVRSADKRYLFLRVDVPPEAVDAAPESCGLVDEREPPASEAPRGLG
jgi:hypothetical protein